MYILYTQSTDCTHTVHVKMNVHDTIYCCWCCVVVVHDTIYRLLFLIPLCSCNEGRMWSMIPAYTLGLLFPIATTVLLCVTKRESYQTQCYSVIFVSFPVSGHNSPTHNFARSYTSKSSSVWSVLPSLCEGPLCNVYCFRYYTYAILKTLHMPFSTHS